MKSPEAISWTFVSGGFHPRVYLALYPTTGEVALDRPLTVPLQVVLIEIPESERDTSAPIRFELSFETVRGTVT